MRMATLSSGPPPGKGHKADAVSISFPFRAVGTGELDDVFQILRGARDLDLGKSCAVVESDCGEVGSGEPARVGLIEPPIFGADRELWTDATMDQDHDRSFAPTL